MANCCLAYSPELVDIVPSSLAALAAEDRGGAELASLLGVRPPLSWPPPFNDTATRAWMRRLFAEHPNRPGLGNWYIVAKQRLVGVCGGKGPPDTDGTVEIGYAVVPAEQSKGYASVAVRRLIDYLGADQCVKFITAETLPAMLASQRLLVRNGFFLASERHHFACGRLLQFRRPAR